jgi:predicted helicase
MPDPTVFHYDLYGKRNINYSFLLENTLKTVKWKELELNAPYYFFVPKDFPLKEEYDKGFSVSELFTIYNSGVKTDRDSLFIDDDRKLLENRIKTLLSGEFDKDFRQKFSVEDSSSYKLTKLIKGKRFDDSFIQKIEYRPFDKKWIYYSPALISRSADKVMKHFIKDENIGLICERIVPNKNTAYRDFFITNTITDGHSIGSNTYVFPLYLYGDAFGKTEKKANLDEKIVGEICVRTGLVFAGEPVVGAYRICPDKTDTNDVGVYNTPLPQNKTVAPMDILDYIYAVLHSPSYREKYKEFLKIDFPCVPYPEDAEQFWKMVTFGGRLRRLHLLEDTEIVGSKNFSPLQNNNKGTYPLDYANFPIVGSNVVEKIHLTPCPSPKERGDSPPLERLGEVGRVYINDTQYFDNVPQEAWNFYIGGYQPAQKWLKDRKGRKLGYNDIEHYQKIIRALMETNKIMKEIDKIIKK